MSQIKSFDESLREMVKQYITENLSVCVQLETLYGSEPFAVRVSVELEGHEICSDRSVF